MKKQHFYIWQGVFACLIGCFMFVFVFVGAGAWAQTETQTQTPNPTQDQPELNRPRFIPDSVIGIMIGHNNDLFFGFRDRWRSAGAYAAAMTQSKADKAASNDAFRRAKSFHMTGEIVAPIALNAPLHRIDRPYAGIASFGMAWHNVRVGGRFGGRGELHQRIYADVSFVGPNTGAIKVQEHLHHILGGLAAPPSDAVRDTQVGNAIYPTVNYELAWQNGGAKPIVRYFGEAQAGVESFVRIGADVLIGQNYIGGFVLREPVAGHVLAISGQRPYKSAFAFGFGGDVSFIADSRIFGDVKVLRTRTRLRAGVYWQRRQYDLFLGAVHLGREFPAQKEGQLSGSVDMMWHF